MVIRTIYTGNSLDVLKTLPNQSVQMCVTSPPYYGLRDYGMDEQIGLEQTPQEYIDNLVAVFREVRRVLKDDGTLWVNIGDSYCGTGDKGDYKDPKYADGRNGQGVSRNKDVVGCKHKDLIGIPWMLAFALRNDGWYLRQDIIWHKPNPMPESVTDRCTKAHEYIFLLSKQPRYYFDNVAIQEEANPEYLSRYNYIFNAGKVQEHFRPNGATNTMGMKTPPTKHKNLQENGQRNHTMHERRADGLPDDVYLVKNKRDVWSIVAKPFKGAHFATFPEALVEPCILAGSRKGDTVLDPFNGAATTGVVCLKNDREYIGIELNPQYVEISEKRLYATEMEIYMEKNQLDLFSDEDAGERGDIHEILAR